MTHFIQDIHVPQKPAPAAEPEMAMHCEHCSKPGVLTVHRLIWRDPATQRQKLECQKCFNVVDVKAATK
jgi:hypothetical protein